MLKRQSVLQQMCVMIWCFFGMALWGALCSFFDLWGWPKCVHQFSQTVKYGTYGHSNQKSLCLLPVRVTLGRDSLQQWLMLAPNSSAVGCSLCTGVVSDALCEMIWIRRWSFPSNCWNTYSVLTCSCNSHLGAGSFASGGFHRMLTFSCFFYNTQYTSVKYPKMSWIISELRNSETIEAGSISLCLNLGTFNLYVQRGQCWGSGLSVCVERSTGILNTFHISSTFATWRFPGIQGRDSVYLAALRRFLLHLFPWFPWKSMQTFTTQSILQ